jgi:hypothetical protein
MAKYTLKLQTGEDAATGKWRVGVSSKQSDLVYKTLSAMERDSQTIGNWQIWKGTRCIATGHFTPGGPPWAKQSSPSR